MKVRISLGASVLAMLVTMLATLAASPLAHAQYPGVNGEIMVQATVPRIPASDGSFQRIVLMHPETGEITRQLSSDWGTNIQINFGPVANTWITNYSGHPNNSYMWRFHLNPIGSLNENGIHLPSSNISPPMAYNYSSWNTIAHPDWLRDGSIVYLRQQYHPVPPGTPLGTPFTTIHRWDADASVLGDYEITQLPGELPMVPRSLAASPVHDEIYVEAVAGRTENVAGYRDGLYRYDTVSGSSVLMREARETRAGDYTFREDLSVEDVSPDGDHVLVIEKERYDGPENGPDGEAPLTYSEIEGTVSDTLKLMPRSGGEGSAIWEGPAGHRIASAKFSPDGEQVAFTVVNKEWPTPNPVPPPQLHVMSLGGGDHDVHTIRVKSTGGVPTVATAATEVGWHPIPVVSDFEITPDPTSPGTFKYTSRAESVQFEGLRLSWDFGNGGDEQDGDGFIEITTYDEPGTYQVTHTVTAVIDGQDVTGQTTKDVVVAAPELSASITWDEEIESEDGRLPLGKTFPGKITVRADDDGVGALSNLAFDDDQFAAISPDGILDVTTEEELPEPFSLDPGEKREFPVEITTTAKGEVTISGGVTGVDAAGDPVEATFSKTTNVGHEFEVEVEAKLVDAESGDLLAFPVEGLELEVDEETGLPKPRDVVFDIEVKNVAGENAEGAKLDLRALNRDLEVRNASAPMPLEFGRYQIQVPEGHGEVVVAGGADQIRGIELGDVADQGIVKVRLWGRVQDKAIVRTRAIVRAVTTGDPVRELSGNGSSEDLRVDQPLLLLIDGDTDSPSLIKAGENWVFSGSIKNMSPTETIDLVVLTHAVGNVVGSPVDRLLTPSNNPLGLRHQLEPGERLALWQRFSTIHDGAPSAKVELIVRGRIPDPGPPAGHRLVTSAETIVRTVNGDPATERRVMVNVDDPVPYSDWDGTELGWVFTDAVARGFGRWIDSTWELGVTVTTAAYHVSVAPWYAMTFTYRMMDEDEREAVAEQVAAYYQELSEIEISPAAAKAKVDQIITNKIVNVSQEWETGNAAYFTEATGSLLGETVPDIVLEVGVAKAFAKISMTTHGWKAMDKVDDVQRASLAGRVAAKGRKGFEPGDGVSLDNAYLWWGMDAAMDRRIRDYVKKKGIVIAMRDRSPGSVAKLRAGLLGKIEKIKAKNVTELDVKWLGFADSHLDTAMYKRMRDWAVYEQRLIDRGFVPGSDTYQQVHARWAQRTKEFAKEHPEMAKYAVKGKLPTPPKALGMNVVDNGYPELKNAPWESTDFELADSSRPGSGLDPTWDGEPAYQPRVWHGGDGHDDSFRAFTGDMDMIAILDARGKILGKERRLEVYRELAELGFEHPESLTWDNIAGRANYVADYDIAVANSDVLLGYMQDGTRRAFKLDSRKSITEDPKYNFLMLHGMTADWDAPEPSVNPMPPLPTLVSQVMPGEPDIEVDPYMGPPGDDRADYDGNDPDAPLLREEFDGSLQRFDPNSNTWVPFSPPTTGPVTQLPQTSLTANVTAGSNHVPIIEPDVLGTGGGDQDWFEAGQQVVFDPGGPNQEIHTVQALGSIITAAPLRFDHAAGEIVGVLPGSVKRIVAPTPPVVSPPIVTTPVVTARPSITPTRGISAIDGRRRATVATIRCPSNSGDCRVVVPRTAPHRVGRAAFMAQVNAPATLRAGSNAKVTVTVTAQAARALTRRFTRVAVAIRVTNSVGVAARKLNATVAKATGRVQATAPILRVPRSGRVVVGTVMCPAGAGTCTVVVPRTVRVRIAGRVWVGTVQATRRMRAGSSTPLRLALPATAAARLTTRPLPPIRITASISNEGGTKRSTITVRLRR